MGLGVSFKTFTSLFFWIAIIASPTLVCADTSNSTSIGISVVVPERVKNQNCTIGFENTNNDKFVSLQHSGCQYDSNKLLKMAYQQAINNKSMQKNSQGFVTVVISTP